MNNLDNKYGEYIGRRRCNVRQDKGHHGSRLALPDECAGVWYDRYIDRESGIVTCVPFSNFGKDLGARVVGQYGYNGKIALPRECVNVRYNCYTDRKSPKTGIITLIPEGVMGNKCRRGNAKIATEKAQSCRHCSMIVLPPKYIGIRYDRYLDRETGIVTLVPLAVTEKQAKLQLQEEAPEEPQEEPLDAPQENSIIGALTELTAELRVTNKLLREANP